MNRENRIRIVIGFFLLLVFFSFVSVIVGINTGKDICVNSGGEVFSLDGVVTCVNLDVLDYCKDANNVLFKDEEDNVFNFSDFD